MRPNYLPDQLTDHHAHIFSPAAHALLESLVGRPLPPFTGNELIESMDRDNVTKAAVLSVGYMFASPDQGHSDPSAVSSENDWVLDQVERRPDRLVGFFSVNPTLEASEVEIERNTPNGFAGLKLHLANSDLDLRDPSHLKKLGNTFEQANSLGLAIVIHLRTRRPDYGRQDAELFVEHVLSKARQIPVQIAHVGGWSGYDEPTDQALSVLANWLQGAPPSSIYLDISAVVKGVHGGSSASSDIQNKWSPENRYQRLAEKLRKVGLGRVFFGTDWPEWTPRPYATDVLGSLPLDPSEMSLLFENRAEWLR